MSHAANLGRLEIVQAVAEFGARDYQYAFDHAILQGRIECARWLYAHSARLVPGIIMGSCETLEAAGFGFLIELGAPIVDQHGNRLAPLAHVLETYAGNPDLLALFVEHGYNLPDTPMMAFHRATSRVSALTSAQIRNCSTADSGCATSTRRVRLSQCQPSGRAHFQTKAG